MPINDMIGDIVPGGAEFQPGYGNHRCNGMIGVSPPSHHPQPRSYGRRSTVL
jgi:hypothetical protein